MNIFISTTIIILIILLSGSWIVASQLTQPANSVIGNPPPDINITQATFNGVSGWFIINGDNEECVLLMHGIRSNRLSMIDRARFLLKNGYSVFLIDLQAHGESTGDKITFGLKESVSAHKAIDYLKTVQQCQKIASLGISLGGAASLLGDKPIEIDACILEAVYPSIEQAVHNRIALRLGSLATVLAPMLYLQIPLRIDISLSSLQPDEAIKHIKAPVLIIAGTEDRHTTPAESRELYNNAPHPKQIWLVEGATHIDFYNFSRHKYERTVLDFLNKYLRNKT